jgi:uncharacterized metal-binding protein
MKPKASVVECLLLSWRKNEIAQKSLHRGKELRKIGGKMTRVACTSCGVNPCENGNGNELLDGCPMTTSKSVLDNALRRYREAPQLKQIARAAALVESRGYMRWTRVEDTMEFAKLMGYKRLGIACCIGLKREGAILDSILRRNGFQVASVICKTGGVPKEKVGVKDNEKVLPGRFEPMCNPVAQAMLLDSCGAELNIMVGLCVGHDALFSKTSKAPVTTLVAKDRVLCHNPVASLYNHQSYYKKKLYEDHLTARKSSYVNRLADSSKGEDGGAF